MVAGCAVSQGKGKCKDILPTFVGAGEADLLFKVGESATQLRGTSVDVTCSASYSFLPRSTNNNLKRREATSRQARGRAVSPCSVEISKRSATPTALISDRSTASDVLTACVPFLAHSLGIATRDAHRRASLRWRNARVRVGRRGEGRRVFKTALRASRLA